jgi:hypothetical protein
LEPAREVGEAAGQNAHLIIIGSNSSEPDHTYHRQS